MLAFLPLRLPLLRSALVPALVTTLAFFAALTLATACKSTKDETIPRLSQEQIRQHFEEGTLALRNRNYKKAVKNLAVIAHDHPYSALAPRAQVLLAFAYYRRNQKAEAIIEVESFIRAYPSSPSLPYALYLKGLIYFQHVRHIERTQVDMTKAEEAFQTLINRFPASPYAQDAKAKLNLARTQLVAHEVQSARFYLRNKNPLAAAEQLIETLSAFPTTIYTPEMLYRLVEASLGLGLFEEAKLWQDFLTINYPENAWTKRADKRMERSSTPERVRTLVKVPDSAPSPAALPPQQSRQP